MINLPLDWKPGEQGPIGVFDSGYGGLTVLKELQARFPAQDFIYLGDNARAPYGTRSFETIYHYCLEAVKHLFDRGCPLVIFACNTASAKALRTIQQKHLGPSPQRRVLGIIRPMTESLAQAQPLQGSIGILGTSGTVSSNSYLIELSKLAPQLEVFQQACPMWVPLVENQELDNSATDYFIDKYISQILEKSPQIEKLILACTHYPLLQTRIESYLAKRGLAHIQVLTQGEVVADKLQSYLNQHREMAMKLSQNSKTQYLTTETTQLFNERASLFLGQEIQSQHAYLQPCADNRLSSRSN